MCRSWAFSLAFDCATHQSTSFLDLHFRVFIPNYHSIVNMHGCTLPMFDRHTGAIMSMMVSKFLTVLCPDWTIRLLGLTSDGACNMTGWVAGVVTHLDAAMHSDCSLIRIWCGVHQLDLVMEDIMNNVIKERFFSVMTGFITHLTRQQNLIAEMQTTCPLSSITSFRRRRSSIGLKSIGHSCSLISSQSSQIPLHLTFGGLHFFLCIISPLEQLSLSVLSRD
jgi:hypothetical protein